FHVTGVQTCALPILRFGRYLASTAANTRASEERRADGERYLNAGTVALQTMLDEPYLSTDNNHEGLLLHSVYHWPRRWDHVPEVIGIASCRARSED